MCLQSLLHLQSFKTFTEVVNILFYHSKDGKTGIAGLAPCCIADPAVQSSSPASESSACFVNHPVFVFCSHATIKCIYTIPIVSVAQGAFGPRRPSLAEQAAFLHVEIDCDKGKREASICLGCLEKFSCDTESKSVYCSVPESAYQLHQCSAKSL